MNLAPNAPTDAAALPVWTIGREGLDKLPEPARAWAAATRFKAGAGEVLLVPGEGASLAGAVLGLGAEADAPARSLLAGALGRSLPEGDWRLEGPDALDADLAALAYRIGAYRFERYRANPDGEPRARLLFPAEVEARAGRLAASVALARDLINTPANDMLPDAIEAAVRAVGTEFSATVTSIVGDDLLAQNFPMIHAVGRASSVAPRLIELLWGREDAPRVTLVGKGVAFDTGGLDIKPASGMLLMKKDMGGAANVLGLARAIMDAGLHVRLRVLVPSVENAISASAFRPGDILKSRKGRTVEIGNTDAEGRLILADALALADEEAPELLIDMATLTGAARVALGPDLPPFFTADEAFAADLAAASAAVADPLWRLPLHKPYARSLASKIADINNVTPDGFAGAITAALFLEGFVEKAASWTHLDVYGWRPQASHLGPVGGEAQGLRALFQVIEGRYPHAG
ncbi:MULTISPECIES: leucyl aminopeptidase family protein [unclassified Aureimonas]|uniref:leucyl aminopeptidase family protein n=1 Tax=unclassified Aureimonas TaxID=2615206 RepID=UPI0006FCE3C7|nr:MULTISPECIES: leucyl aminopeptidase family protein [unclassified Aureimonas]KQT54037.1 cytochrome C oxidase subunit II [Aureimonas sp. Leaf427]KQT71781.1 cytochrome C oxidase subunit II [Aureimonas sp. Leaf460]